jgi:hypothetical protein
MAMTFDVALAVGASGSAAPLVSAIGTVTPHRVRRSLPSFRRHVSGDPRSPNTASAAVSGTVPAEAIAA